MEDTEIVELYFQRDESALTETAKKYDSYCYTIAYHVLNEEEDAKETVNDTYWETWNSIPPHRPQWLGAFIGKITRRLAISRFRKRTAVKRGGGEYELTLSELSECIPDKTDTAKAVEDKLLTAAINRFLQGLPAVQRKVFVCRYWYFDSVKAIAGQFGFSESKVKSMLMRTRQKLKQTLTEEGLL